MQTRKTEELRAAFEAVMAPSRAVEGVLNFDLARDIADPDPLIASEVFADRAVLGHVQHRGVVRITDLSRLQWVCDRRLVFARAGTFGRSNCRQPNRRWSIDRRAGRQGHQSSTGEFMRPFAFWHQGARFRS